MVQKAVIAVIAYLVITGAITPTSALGHKRLELSLSRCIFRRFSICDIAKLVVGKPVPKIPHRGLDRRERLTRDWRNHSASHIALVLDSKRFVAVIIVPLKRLVRPVQAHQPGVSATELTDFSPVGFHGYQSSLHITSQRTPPLSTPLPTSSPAPALPGTDQGAQLAEHQRQMIAIQEEQTNLMRQQMATMAQSMGQLSHAVSIIASNSVTPSLVGGYAQSAGYAASDAGSRRSSKSQIKPAFQPVSGGSEDDDNDEVLTVEYKGDVTRAVIAPITRGSVSAVKTSMSKMANWREAHLKGLNSRRL